MKNYDGYMWAASITVNDDDLWILRGDVCSIWKYNISKDLLEFIDVPKVGSYQNEGQYISIIIAESKLFLIPYFANHVAVFDMGSSEWCAPIEMPFREEGSRFIGAACWKGNIYCFPENKPDSVVVINAHSLSITELVNIWGQLPEVSEQINEIKITDNGQIVGIVRFKKIAFIYDIETKDVRLIYEKSNNMRWNTVGYLDGQLFINGPESKEILVYDLLTLNLIKKIKIPFIKTRMKSICDKLVIDATTMDKFLVLDIQNDELREIDTREFGDVVFDRDYMTGAIEEFNGKVIYHDRRRAVLIVMNTDMCEVRRLNASKIETKKMKDNIAKEVKSSTFFELENNVVGLEEFINIIIK